MSDFFYELSCLINCKHFVDVFSLIIVIVTSTNIILFVLMKEKTLNVNSDISHYVQTLNNDHSMKLGAL